MLPGEIAGTPFYISAPPFGAWQHTNLFIDVVPGQSSMFSLGHGTGQCVLTRSRRHDGRIGSV